MLSFDLGRGLGRHLARADFTVVTYDRRGLARSPCETLPTFAQHAEDAAALATEVGAELVFGASFGALVGLEMVTRRPVRRFVCHEPPATSLMSPEECASARPARRTALR